MRYDGGFYVPVFADYPETTFGGEFPTEADYRDPYVQKRISQHGWTIWPPIPFSYNTINYDLPVPAPSPPDAVDWLGTDDQGRDVLARLLYGFRISVLFGLTLTLSSSVIGIAAGAVQGYFGGLIDLLFQRFIEIWSGLPALFLLIILASIVQPNFWWLLGIDAAVHLDGSRRSRAARSSCARATSTMSAPPARSASPTPRSSCATCCPTPWSPPSPSCPSS